MNSGAFENIAHKDENGKPRRACGKTAAARLGDIFDLQMGKTPSRNNISYWENGTHNWVSIADLGNYQKYVGYTKEKITDVAIETTGIKIVPSNTVIMSFKLSLGKAAITEEPVYTNEAIMAFIPTGKYDVSPDYFYYFLSGRDWSNDTHRAVMGTTLNKTTLAAININLPPLDEQRRIASLLDKISELAAKRRRQLDKLDELVKSRFVEMFVDFMDNHDDKMTLADVCKIITDGTHQPPKFVSSGIPFLFVSNIVTNEITYEAEKFISEDTYQELIKRTPVEPGDILLSTVGSYGHPAIVKSDKPFCFQRHIAYLKPKSDLADSVYLHSAILSDDVQRQIEKSVKGIAQKTLNLSEIRKIKVPLPSLDLQRRFSETVGHIDKIKLKVHASLEKLETLKKSKMQEFFGNAG